MDHFLPPSLESRLRTPFHAIVTRSGAPLLLGVFVGAIGLTAGLAACSGSNPAGPGSVNPNLPAATGPAGSAPSGAGAPAELQSVSGDVLDAQTGKPVPKAKVYVELLSTVLSAASPSLSASGAVPIPPEASGGAMPQASGPVPVPGAGPGGLSLSASPMAPVTVEPDDQGHFEVKDLPMGDYAITVYAPGYLALTLVGTKPTKLEVPLVPLEPASGANLGGTVNLANGQPATGVTVASDFTPGYTTGDVERSGTDGGFVLQGLTRGRHDVLAFTTAGKGEVGAYAMASDVPVDEGKEHRTGKPILVLHAVTDPVILSGTVDPSKDKIAPRQIQVRLQTDRGEIPLVTEAIGKDHGFRFVLPPVPEGGTYHLVASGADDAGDLVTVHQSGISDSDLQLDLKLPALPPVVQVATGSAPVFTWDAQNDATAYRVRVESTGPSAQTLWEGWTSMTRVTMPEVLHVLRKGRTYRYSMTALAVANDAAASLSTIQAVPWAWSASRAPQEFTLGKTTPPAKDTAPFPSPAALVPPAPRHSKASGRPGSWL